MATEANEELSDFLYAIFVAIGQYIHDYIHCFFQKI